jgi:hypothetical protein
MPWEAPVYWTHPEGKFPAKLVKVEEQALNRYGASVKWTFETNVERDDGKPPELSKLTSMTLSAGSKAGEIILALGFEIPCRDDIPNFDAKALIGSECQITVKHDDKGDGNVWANIELFEPVRKQATSGFQAGSSAKDRTLKTATDAAAAGCPDPSYDHSLKPGKPGFDPFHSESCPLMETVTV